MGGGSRHRRPGASPHGAAKTAVWLSTGRLSDQREARPPPSQNWPDRAGAPSILNQSLLPVFDDTVFGDAVWRVRGVLQDLDG